MATIEPRLMHLLNNTNVSSSSSSSTEASYYPPQDLPPIQSLSSFSKPSSLSLPPLEPDTAAAAAAAAAAPNTPTTAAGSASAPPHHEKSASSKSIHRIPSLASIREEYNAGGGRYSHDGAGPTSAPGRQHHSGGISLHMLYDNPEINDSSHSLNHFLDDVPESASADDLSTKKRQRAMTVKDDIMHLPQPLKKQKSSQNISQNIMPPIINGLYEPPPNAAVFPPIALDEGNNEGVAPSTLHALNHQLSTSSTVLPTSSLDAPDAPEMHVQSEGRHDSISTAYEGERPLAKVKRKAAKPRKKWSEEETKHLLLGVSKYGVGKWTSILDDPEYSFNGRTAGDLKDRFRTCCPDELRIGPSKSRESLRAQDKHASQSPTEPRPKGKSKTALLLEDILADPDDLVGYHNRDEFVSIGPSNQGAVCQPESDTTAKPKKSRAHRKKIEDLQAMGIHGPFKKSHRRERRPFTQQDDDQILEGLQMYGPAWTKIQRDPRFDLSSRQPTDLRDRVRNKYPEMYKQIEEKQGHGKESLATGTSLPSRPAPSARNNSVMEPSVNNIINENSLMTLEPHLHRSASREEVMMPKWAASMPSAPGSGGASHGGSFHELPGMDSLSRDLLETEAVEGAEPSSSGAFSGMMDISRLLLDG